MVAHSRVDEPLDVEIMTIRAAADPDRPEVWINRPLREVPRA